MIMFPEYCRNDIEKSEIKVFNKLKYNNDKVMDNWICYHSLNYPVHISKKDKKSYKYYGEADFVILIPGKGIINIEVKGGSLKCNDGIWSRRERGGWVTFNKSPIKQAHNSKYDIGEEFRKKLGVNFPQEFVVLFPDCSVESIIDPIEFSPMNIIDSDNFSMNFEKRLIELSNILLAGGGKLNLSKEYVDKLKKIIRPDFFLLEKKSSILSKSASELFDYTEEQIATFDLLEDHPRLIIEGPMGTGKTAICEEIIKRKKINKDLSILYINSTRLPNLEMKEKFINDKNVKCYTYNQFIKKIAQYSESTNLTNISDKKTSSFEDLNDALTIRATSVLKNEIENTLGNINNANNEYLFDTVLIDEAQNCYFYDQFYELLNLIVKGGTFNGNFYIFGDFKYQKTVPKNYTKDKLDNRMPINNLLNIKEQMLTLNVRNAKQIAQQAPILSGYLDKLPYILNKSQEGEVFHSFSKDIKEKQKELIDIISKLHKDDVLGADITIISNYKLSNKKNILNSLDLSDYYDAVIDLGLSNISKVNEIKKKTNNIYFSTAMGFQGMENKIIIYLDPFDYFLEINEVTNNDIEALTFNVMGRANTYLYMLWNKSFEKKYYERIKILTGTIINA